jgi:hypothetical protein
MFLEHEFEHAIAHDGHPIAVIEGRAIFYVWGLIADFDWKISELWLRDTDSRELFKLDLESRLGQEIATWLYANKSDYIEEKILEAA